MNTVPEIPTVATKEFVPANSRENYRYTFPGQLGNKIGCEASGVSDGFVEMPDQLRQKVAHFWPNNDFVMLCPEGFGDEVRVRQFVVVAVLALVANGVSLHGPSREPRHRRDDHARVDPSAEKGAERNIADEL